MDVNNKIPVTLAGKDFVVKQIPMARIKRLGTVVANAVKDVDPETLSTENGVNALLDKLLDVPHSLLSLFIDDLPVDIFHDEENGVTLPEFTDVLKKAFELNRVDTLKNVFSRLTPTLIQAQASMSQKTS